MTSFVSRVGIVRYPITEPRDAECAAKLAKCTLTNLYNERPAWLANAHAKLNAAVAAAYGWPADLSDDEILSRLLALNRTRAAEEAQSCQSQETARHPPKGRRRDAVASIAIVAAGLVVLTISLFLHQ